jgi:flagellar biosynthesis anti-sigma factor FlgM
MTITPKGSPDPELSQLAQNDKAMQSLYEYDAKVHQGSESAKVDISPEARKLQRVAELVRTGDQLRADKVKQLKEQIKADQYQIDSKEVAKSIARNEVIRLLAKK